MSGPRTTRLSELIVEIVSDAGEGAQKAALCFAQVCARAGNGLWTVEIIPSEIQPPPHTTGSASGNRIRLAERSTVTNAGDRANVVLAFNEMALLSRIEANSVADQHPDLLARLVGLAEQSHEPVQPGTFRDRARHERDRKAKWGSTRAQADNFGGKTYKISD